MKLPGTIKIKICGMKDPENIANVIQHVSPDWMGFIFYPDSPRYYFSGEKLRYPVTKVGVFVNEKVERILELGSIHQLDLIQFHGDEQPHELQTIKEAGYGTIKAIRVDEVLDSDELELYKTVVDFFLFDTKGETYGGTGRRFNWNLLRSYDLNIPYFLSGGLDLESIAEINFAEFPGMVAIDINSGFELQPGIKDIERLKELRR